MLAEMVYIGMSRKDLSKQECVELSFKLSPTLRVGRFRRLAGSEFQTDGAMKVKERSRKGFKLRAGIFEKLLF